MLLLSNAGVVLRPYSVGAYPLDDADAGDSFARSDSVRFLGIVVLKGCDPWQVSSVCIFGEKEKSATFWK